MRGFRSQRELTAGEPFAALSAEIKSCTVSASARTSFIETRAESLLQAQQQFDALEAAKAQFALQVRRRPNRS